MARWPLAMGSTISILLSVGLLGVSSGTHVVCIGGRADMASVGRSPKSSNDMPRMTRPRSVTERALSPLPSSLR